MNTKTKTLVGILGLAAMTACSNGGGGGDGGFSMMVEAPNGSGLAGASLGKVKPSANTVRDVTLTPGITVMGTVTDGVGAPMPGVEVSFKASPNMPAMEKDTTDGAGMYSLELGSGSWMAVVDPNDNDLGIYEFTNLDVAAPGPVTYDFQLPATFVVSGSVTEAGGPGIANSDLEFQGRDTGAKVSVTADLNGDYTATLVPDWYYVVVEPMGASALTHLKEKFSTGSLTMAGTENYALTAGVTASGTISGMGGPEADVEVDVVLGSNSVYYAPNGVQADGAGNYSIGPVPTGSVTFQLEADDDSGYPVQQQSRNFAAPGPQAGVDFLLQAGYVLSGIVYQNDGITPEGNVEIELVPVNGSLAPDDDDTGGGGDYEISAFPGEYDMYLTPETTNLQLPEVRRITLSADTTLDVTLVLGALVQGTVFQPDGITPEEDVRVEVEGVLGAYEVSDGSGNYEFLVPAGTHDLTLTAEDGQYEDMALDSFVGLVATAGATVPQDLTMVLSISGANQVSGTVYQPDGVTPAVGSEVTAVDKYGDVIARTFSDVTGAYVLVFP